MKAQGFTVHHAFNLKPQEDYFFINESRGVLSIADGITRDPQGMPNLPSMKNPLGMLKFFLNYPGFLPRQGYSPAYLSAANFCHTFNLAAPIFMHENKLNPERAIRYAFQEGIISAANLAKQIKQEREWPEFDYLEHDFPGCVAIGLLENHGIINYGYISDCTLASFSRQGELLFKTLNEGPNSKGSIDGEIKRKYGFSFNDPRGRVLVRKDYRNNPSNPLSYGAITGELEAMHYLRTGQLRLGDNILIACSDGLEDLVSSREFSSVLNSTDFNEVKAFCQSKVKTEGTLIKITK